MSFSVWYIHVYGIHHRRIFEIAIESWPEWDLNPWPLNSVQTLTNWAIRPWVQFAVRANFVQLLQFHLSIQCSHFISAIVFGNRHICFNQNLGQAITCIYVYIYIYIYIYIGGIRKSQKFAYSSPPGKILHPLGPLDFPHQIFFPSPQEGNSSPH